MLKSHLRLAFWKIWESKLHRLFIGPKNNFKNLYPSKWYQIFRPKEVNLVQISNSTKKPSTPIWTFSWTFKQSAANCLVYYSNLPLAVQIQRIADCSNPLKRQVHQCSVIKRSWFLQSENVVRVNLHNLTLDIHFLTSLLQTSSIFCKFC